MRVAELLPKASEKVDNLQKFKMLYGLAVRSHCERTGVGKLTPEEGALLQEHRAWLLEEESSLRTAAEKAGEEYRIFIGYTNGGGGWGETRGYQEWNRYHVRVYVPMECEAVLGVMDRDRAEEEARNREQLATMHAENVRAEILRRHLAGEDIVGIANRLPADAGIVAKALEAASKESGFKDTVLATARLKALQLGNKGMDAKAEAKAMERRIKQDLETYQSRIVQRSLAAEIEANDGGTSSGIDLAGTWPGEESEERAMVTPRFHRDGNMTIEKLIGKGNE